jgi:hypothetical protein
MVSMGSGNHGAGADAFKDFEFNGGA